MVIFDSTAHGIMGLSVPGCIAWHFWRQIPNHNLNVELDEFVVMPNHLHGILGIKSEEKINVRTLHATSVRKCNANGHEYFGWRGRFYDHIIRNDQALQRIRKYIWDNPKKWQQNRENPGRVHEQAVEYMAGED